ncbi:hypothetical protein EVA_05246 [gut metagenome]|uniref:Uncharacterized protein n=1 Tax=gut metagenome TaxID=749906 RepID=J9GHT8_9ZZZZ
MFGRRPTGDNGWSFPSDVPGGGKPLPRRSPGKVPPVQSVRQTVDRSFLCARRFHRNCNNNPSEFWHT